jgi:hypothetical protein
MRWWALFTAALSLSAAAHATETITYQYDVHGRLTQVNHSGTVNNGLQSTYSYDPADNRTSLAVTGGWTCGGASTALRSSAKVNGQAQLQASEAAPPPGQKTLFITAGTSWTAPSAGAGLGR